MGISVKGGLKPESYAEVPLTLIEFRRNRVLNFQRSHEGIQSITQSISAIIGRREPLP
jgi:hypothetical protein